MMRIFLFAFFALMIMPVLRSQEDLLSLLDERPVREFATAGFKTNRVINLHSFELTPAKTADFKINHRFGYISSGIHEMFGLDQSSVRIGLDYGVTDNLQLGIGRSSVDKVIDGYVKYRILRQSSGPGSFPLSVIAVLGSGVKTNPFAEEDRDYALSHRLDYSVQLIVGRKFSPAFSMQLVPGVVHRNLVSTSTEKNDVWNLGMAFRQKISKRIAVNGEYIYVLPGQLAGDLHHSISIGLDIETGGHVFQLHFTNSTLSHEAGFITATRGDILDGDIHFGFNVSRVFSL